MVELDDVDWLDTRVDQLGGEEACVVPGDMGMEEAVEVSSVSFLQSHIRR